MLPADEWDKEPDVVSVLKPMIMGHLEGEQSGYTAKKIIEDMGLLEHELFREVEPADVLTAVETTLRVLGEDGKIQVDRVPVGNSIWLFYRPVPRPGDR